MLKYHHTYYEHQFTLTPGSLTQFKKHHRYICKSTVWLGQIWLNFWPAESFPYDSGVNEVSTKFLGLRDEFFFRGSPVKHLHHLRGEHGHGRSLKHGHVPHVCLARAKTTATSLVVFTGQVAYINTPQTPLTTRSAFPRRTFRQIKCETSSP